jgi:hypothetical protein
MCSTAQSLLRFIGEPQPSPCLILGTPELAGDSAIDRDSSRELGHGLGSRRLQKFTERLGGTRLGGSDGGGCKGLLFYRRSEAQFNTANHGNQPVGRFMRGQAETLFPLVFSLLIPATPRIIKLYVVRIGREQFLLQQPVTSRSTSESLQRKIDLQIKEHLTPWQNKEQ